MCASDVVKKVTMLETAFSERVPNRNRNRAAHYLEMYEDNNYYNDYFNKDDKDYFLSICLSLPFFITSKR